MDQQMVTLLIVAIVVLAIGVVLAWTVTGRKRARLKKQFGPEYDRTVQQLGEPVRAEAVLAERERRVAALSIRALTPDQRDRYADTWRRVQARFVDDPRGAVTEADRLVADVMDARGYPVGDFEQRAADVSVHHPHVVENYRAARAISTRHARGEAGTEDLRQAMVHYRALFSDLLDVRAEPEPVQPRRR